MKINWRKYAPLSTMLVFPFLGTLYALVDHPTDRVFSLVTAADQGFPFVKYFVYPYAVWIFYIYVCLVYFFFKDPRVYFKALVTYIVATLLCYLIYSVFQTTVPRPILAGDDLTTRLLAYVYDRDQPFNCFPSIHVMSSYLMIKALRDSDFRNRWNQLCICLMSGLIIASTQFIKQHVILDALAGYLLTEIVYLAVSRLTRTEKTYPDSALPFH